MPWGLAAQCRPAPTGQGTGARQWTWETAPRARRHEGTRPPPAATSTCPHGGEPAPGEEQVRGPGCRAAAQSQGSGGWPGPAWAGLGGCGLPGRPSLGDRPCWRSPLYLFISALFRKRGPRGRKRAETSRPADSGTEPARRGSATSSRWAGSASLGPGARAARAACPHEPLWNPAQPSGRLSLGFPPLGLRVSHFRIAHGPPAHGPRARSGPYSRPPTGWPLRPAPAWPGPRRFSGCVLLLQAPPAGGRGTGSGRDALGTEPHRLVSPAASCCPGLRCD